MPESTARATPTRRTIVKGAAWAAPVIAVAVATPAAAASEIAPTNVGSLVESSDNIKDTVLSASSSRVESCFPDNSFSSPFILTATITYDGSDPNFSLTNSTVKSSGNVWSLVSAEDGIVTLTATQTVTCYTGITGFELSYNAGGAIPPLNSLTLNISGTSTDGTLSIDGLVSSLHDYGPVVGPRRHDV